jgi:hypothetical protein
MASTNTHATIEEPFEAVFSIQSVPRLYKEGQVPLEEILETTVRRVVGWYEIATRLGASQCSGLSWLVSE